MPPPPFLAGIQGFDTTKLKKAECNDRSAPAADAGPKPLPANASMADRRAAVAGALGGGPMGGKPPGMGPKPPAAGPKPPAPGPKPPGAAPPHAPSGPVAPPRAPAAPHAPAPPRAPVGPAPPRAPVGPAPPRAPVAPAAPPRAPVAPPRAPAAPAPPRAPVAPTAPVAPVAPPRAPVAPPRAPAGPAAPAPAARRPGPAAPAPAAMVSLAPKIEVAAHDWRFPSIAGVELYRPKTKAKDAPGDLIDHIDQGNPTGAAPTVCDGDAEVSSMYFAPGDEPVIGEAPQISQARCEAGRVRARIEEMLGVCEMLEAAVAAGNADQAQAALNRLAQSGF